MALLSIVTRVHPARPGLLQVCRESVAMQGDKDFQHVLLYDTEGRGVAWANGQFARHADRVQGDYVYMLDDDDRLVRDDVVTQVRAAASSRPDAIMCRFHVSTLGVRPDDRHWTKPPHLGQITTSSGFVRRELWQEYIQHFDRPQFGDFYFWSALWPELRHIVWLDVVMGETQRVSHGAAE